jgi:hypothetical protein
MFIKGKYYVLMDATDGVAGGTGGAPETTAAPAAPAAGGTAPAAPPEGNTTPGTAAPAPNTESALAAAAPTAEAEAAFTAEIPEKYQVKNEDGTINFKASSLKMAVGYGNLVKRLGTDDAPPKSAEEYKVEPPEFLKDWKPDEDESFLDFRKDAHAAGMSQKAFEMTMGKYFGFVQKMAQGGALLDKESCIAELRTEWKSDVELDRNMKIARRGAELHFGDKAKYVIDRYGSDPVLVHHFNKLGKAAREDTPPSNPGSTPSASPIDALMTSPAYGDAKHPDHARVSAQVAAHFAAQAAVAEKAGNAQIM